MEGALSRMSLMKRMTTPMRLPRANSASQIAANKPTGVAMATAMMIITKLP